MPSSSLAVNQAGAGGRHDIYGSALAAHPSRSQGRPDNELELSAHVYSDGVPALHVLPVPRVPDGLTIARSRSGPAGHRGTAAYMPDNGQVERMNRTLKDATVRRYHYASHDELRAHLALFLDAYNHARRLKALRGLTPHEFICQAWTREPERFRLNPLHHTPGLNTY